MLLQKASAIAEILPLGESKTLQGHLQFLEGDACPGEAHTGERSVAEFGPVTICHALS